MIQRLQGDHIGVIYGEISNERQELVNLGMDSNGMPKYTHNGVRIHKYKPKNHYSELLSKNYEIYDIMLKSNHL